MASRLTRRSYGARTYPVAYTYDYAGRLKTMTTWTNYSQPHGAGGHDKLKPLQPAHRRGSLDRICLVISRARSFVTGCTPSSGAK